MLKKRVDAKLNQGQNFNRLIQYAIWGPKSPTTNVLTTAELQQMNPQELVDRIHQINTYEHKILYYGPETAEKVIAIINEQHKVPEKLNPVPAPQTSRCRRQQIIKSCLPSMMPSRFTSLLFPIGEKSMMQRSIRY